MAMLLGAEARGQGADPGRAIFEGQLEGTRTPATAARLARLPCLSCHGRDGLGTREGRAPPIDGPALIRATPERPAYDAESLTRALATGQGAGGRALSQLMPRYALSPDEGRALFDYLGRLPAEQRRGVWPERLRIGVATRAEGYLDALRAALQARLGGTQVHGRTVELVPMAAGETDLLAIVAPPVSQVASVTAAGMPVLFPLGQLSGAEDPGLVRDFLPSAADVRHSLARHLAEAAQGPVAAWPEGERNDAFALAMKLAGREVAPRAGEETAELVVFDAADLGAAIAAAPRARLWIDWRHVPEGPLPSDRPLIVVIDAPALVEAPERALRTRHAQIAGAVLGEILKEAGRDLTRARLMTAFETAWTGDLQLDYAAVPLTGTERLLFFQAQ